MNTVFLSSVPDSKGITTIQKLFASDTLLPTCLFNQHVLIKISDNLKLLCKLVPQLIATDTFASCDSSVIKHAPNKLIDPSTVNLELSINKDDIEPVVVANAKRMVVSVIFKDVNYQNIWSKNLNKLAEAVKNLLQLFVVHNDCIVNLKRLNSKQNLNIDYILVHKTDCKNNGAITTPETSIIVIKTMSAIKFHHAEIGLEIPPLFGMERQVSCLKNIVEAARNGYNNLCNMVLNYKIYCLQQC